VKKGTKKKRETQGKNAIRERKVGKTIHVANMEKKGRKKGSTAEKRKKRESELGDRNLQRAESNKQGRNKFIDTGGNLQKPTAKLQREKVWSLEGGKKSDAGGVKGKRTRGKAPIAEKGVEEGTFVSREEWTSGEERKKKKSKDTARPSRHWGKKKKGFEKRNEVLEWGGGGCSIEKDPRTASLRLRKRNDRVHPKKPPCGENKMNTQQGG